MTITTIQSLNNYLFFFRGSNPGFDATTGYTVEIRMKVHTDTPAGDIGNGLGFQFGDGVMKEYLIFEKGKIKLAFAGGSYDMDTTDDYHVYRATVSGTAIKIYVDGTLRITDLMTEDGNDRMVFGDVSSAGAQYSKSLWDYVKYSTGGAIEP